VIIKVHHIINSFLHYLVNSEISVFEKSPHDQELKQTAMQDSSTLSQSLMVSVGKFKSVYNRLIIVWSKLKPA